MNYTDKKTLRKIFMEKRNQLSFDEIHKKSLTICEKFFQTDFYKNSDFIFTYVNYNSEFETSIIIKKAFNDGKRVAVPVMSGNAHEMFFVEIKSFSELSKNKFGILEPELDFEKVLLPNSKTIIIIPALVFDKRGYRIGYGGGFMTNI